MTTRTKSTKMLVVASLAAAVVITAISVRSKTDRTQVIVPASTRTTEKGVSASSQLQSLIMQGIQLREAGRYKQAAPILKAAVSMAESSFGPNSFELVCEAGG